MDKKIIAKILSGLSNKDIRFKDLRVLPLTLGFTERVKEDHHKI